MSTNHENTDAATASRKPKVLPRLVYTEAEACEIVGMNRDALRHYRELGWLEFLPGGKGGGKILYRLAHLKALLDRIEADAKERAALR